MDKVRAKLTCMSVEETTDGATSPKKTGEYIKFQAVYDSNNSPEDNNFSKYTPFAEYSMSVTNPNVYGFFVSGKAYYFDITSCD